MISINLSRTSHLAGRMILHRLSLRGTTNIYRRCTQITENVEEQFETMKQVKAKIMERLGLDTGYTVKPHSRTHLLQFEPKNEELPLRTMSDSYSSAIIPLSRSKLLQDRYVTVLGHVRLGRLMEDMDLFAVWVCHQHVHLPKLPKGTPLPYTFVTILVDKITFTEFSAQAVVDIRLSGHVSWVGTSSVEIKIWVEQKDGAEYKRLTRAIFLMAARNATNTKSAPVNQLKITNEREKVIYEDGNLRKQRRMNNQCLQLFNVEPNSSEQKLMDQLYQKTTQRKTIQLNSRVLPENAIWMNATGIEITTASFPENRNAHNTAFGGFLMRIALETSWVCASLYCTKRPKLLVISDIHFTRPVPVHYFLKMKAYIVYTENIHLQIMTIADIIDPITNKQESSNVFSYTFRAQEKVREVMPESYEEMLWYIDGRRKFRYAVGGATSEKII